MSIKDEAGRLWQIMAGLEAAIAQLHSDSGRAAPGETASGIQAARQAALEAALRIVRECWGAYTPGERLGDGSVWRALEAADSRIAAVRGAGNAGIDWNELAYEAGRVTSIASRFDNLDQLGEWYDQASRLERRALQDLATKGLIVTRFHDAPGVASFSASLERDREAAVNPDVPAREAEKASLVADILALWRASQGAVRMLEMNVIGLRGRPLSRILGMVLAEGQVLPVAEGDRPAGEYWAFSKRPALELAPGATYVGLG